MAWDQLEPTPPHVVYIVITFFLLLYALFSQSIRNGLHLSEPPLATVFGIIVGPRGLKLLTPHEWGFGDNTVQEFTRLIVGIQCFAVGLELPESFFKRKWRDILVFLGPVMAFGWIVCAALIMILFDTSLPGALVIAACLTPTDPVLAASVLANSQFSTRIPKRLRDILSAESGCNDGVSFPFLYVGLAVLTAGSPFDIFKKWFLVTILYQCVLGTLIGLALGHVFNRVFLFSAARRMIGGASYLAFYLLLAIFAIGLASVLGVDDFLVAFFAGLGFAHNNNSPTEETRLPVVIDLVLNSSLFVFFGSMIPWHAFAASVTPSLTPVRLVVFLALTLVLRRIPIVFSLYKMRLLPHIRTAREALFAGHFGPMGVGALFLALEARAQLETDSSIPLPHPPPYPPHSPGNGTPTISPERHKIILLLWPIICFVVLGSTLVHGLSTLAISVAAHFSRRKHERAESVGGERDRFRGMVFDEEGEEDVENGNVHAQGGGEQEGGGEGERERYRDFT